MSDGIKKGRKPLSSKSGVNINPDDVFTSRLKLPADAEAEAKEKGWELRWVDAQQMFLNGGQHKNGWMPYRRSSAVKDDFGFKLGNDPEGIIRRQSLLLAWRPIEQGDKHRAFLKARRERMSASFLKEEARQLRQAAQGSSIGVIEGFDESDE